MDEPTNHLSPSQDELTSTSNHPSRPQTYPPWIGSKFSPSGTPLPFPGNTIICPLPPTSPLHHSLLTLLTTLKHQPFAPLFAFLPPESWHMTLFEGVTDHTRRPESWPADIPPTTSLPETTTHMKRKLSSFTCLYAPRFRMAITGWEPLRDGIALTLHPVSSDENHRLRSLRNQLADCLNLRHPDHDDYVFHISLAYTLRFLTEQETEATMEVLKGWNGVVSGTFEVELAGPEFCVFRDMVGFEREIVLGKVV